MLLATTLLYEFLHRLARKIYCGHKIPGPTGNDFQVLFCFRKICLMKFSKMVIPTNILKNIFIKTFLLRYNWHTADYMYLMQTVYVLKCSERHHKIAYIRASRRFLIPLPYPFFMPSLLPLSPSSLWSAPSLYGLVRILYKWNHTRCPLCLASFPGITILRFVHCLCIISWFFFIAE